MDKISIYCVKNKIVKTFVVLGFVIYLFYFTFTITKIFIKYPIPKFFEKIYTIICGLIFLFICVSIGKKIFKKFFPEITYSFRSYEKTVFEFALGSIVIEIVIFILGITHCLYPQLIFVLTSGYLLFSYREIFSVFSSISFKEYKLDILLFITSLSLIIMFITCFTPVTYYDSLVYHLSLPKEYLKYHKIFFVEGNFYSLFPQNMEMLFTYALSIGSYSLANLISFIFGIFTILAIYSLSYRLGFKQTANLSVFLFSTTTAIMLLMPSSYVEIGLGFYTIVALYTFLFYLQYDNKQKITFLFLCGVFTAAALGTKYTGGITAGIIFIFLIYLYLKYKKSNLKHIIMFFVIVTLFYSPWGIKNFITVGNPFFPFFIKIFGYKNLPLDIQKIDKFFATITDYMNKSSPFFDLLPWQKLNFQYSSGVEIFGDYGWNIYFLLLPLIFFVIHRLNSETKILVLYIIFHIVVWYFTKPVLRFLIPILPIFSVVVSIIFYSFYNSYNQKFYKIISNLILCSMILLTLQNFILYFNVQKIIDPFWVAIGIVDEEIYLSTKLSNSPYQVFKYINQYLSHEDKILFIGEQRGFYCDKKYIPTNVLAENLYTKIINNSKSLQEVIEKFKMSGITYILYNTKEAQRLKPYGILEFNNHGIKLWQQLISVLPKVVEANGVILYKIV